MHRILREQALQGERRHQRAPQSHAIPRLSAATPNEVWTWDIAKLATQQRGEYLSLYVVMDLFSRYIVAWMLSRKEIARYRRNSCKTLPSDMISLQIASRYTKTEAFL